ncbi:soluble calcium-activated nucleotidase 1 isoform X2 [Frankliniella occidentalis]|uniref:Apyrase n=1 Tax=Frankliniella occidentalis TaxID=133901 RepID=A0A9C6WYX0_FRAOC|nr:soluble calcium-activated nucleotidase 1 isoform X2 [Frankliniella occidentalis]
MLGNELLRERIPPLKEMSLRDWRQALTTPPMYRVGNSTLRIQTHFVCLIAAVGLFVLIVWYAMSPPSRSHRSYLYSEHYDMLPLSNVITPKSVIDSYNATYPLTPPVRSAFGITYRIGVISDLDTDSKSTSESSTWVSYFKKGHLTWDRVHGSASFKWDASEPTRLTSTLGQGKRGMELSELIVFNGKLYAPDDRTGIVYEIDGTKAIPWVLLTNGDGRRVKGFKSEWAAVKDNKLYVGGLGKEWTTSTGELVDFDPMWIKQIHPTGQVSHHDWKTNYEKLRRSVGIEFPGYMIHESAVWSNIHKKWFFLPRKMSKEIYHEDKDPYHGTNLLLTTDENFSNIDVVSVGEAIRTHGFSSFKFIPGTEDDRPK